MKNRKLLLIVSLVLAMTMSLGGTLAYLQDTDADVNTMVLGNVQIVQNEQQWNAEKTKLVEFEQDKPLLPYVGNMGWETVEGFGNEYRRFTMNNVVDKYVTVTNKGNTDAYVRTIIALEMGEYETVDEYYYNIVGTSTNAADGKEFEFDGTWEWDEKYVAQIFDRNYLIMTATHQDALEAKETTIPSLLQVYVNKDCDNEELLKVDGNKNGKLDVLVISQAVQANGFTDVNADGTAADDALAEAFSYTSVVDGVQMTKETTVADWFEDLYLDDGLTVDPDKIGSAGDKNNTNNPPYAPVTSVEELLNADGPITAEVPLKLEKDESVAKPIQVGNDGKLELDLAEKSLNNANGRVFENNGGEANISNGVMAGGSDTVYAQVTAGADAKTTYTEVDLDSMGGGIGAVDGAEVTFNSGSIDINATTTNPRYAFYVVGDGTVVTINNGTFTIEKLTLKRTYIYAGAGTTVYVNGGNFGKASTRADYPGIKGEGTVIITGGTFKFDPTKWVAEGYQAVKEGDTWTVSAK